MFNNHTNSETNRSMTITTTRDGIALPNTGTTNIDNLTNPNNDWWNPNPLHPSYPSITYPNTITSSSTTYPKIDTFKLQDKFIIFYYIKNDKITYAKYNLKEDVETNKQLEFKEVNVLEFLEDLELL